MSSLLVGEAETSQSSAEFLSRKCGPGCLEVPGRPVHRADTILLESHLNRSHGKPPMPISIAMIFHIGGEGKNRSADPLRQMRDRRRSGNRSPGPGLDLHRSCVHQGRTPAPFRTRPAGLRGVGAYSPPHLRSTRRSALSRGTDIRLPRRSAWLRARRRSSPPVSCS